MRNLTLSPKQVATVLELVKEGHYVTTIEKKIGVGPRRIWDQVQAGEAEGASEVLREFAKAFREAEAHAEIECLRSVKTALDWKQVAWVMERRWPKRWAGRSEENREKDEPAPETKALPIEKARELARASKLRVAGGAKR